MSSGGEVARLTVAVHQPEFLPWLGFIDKIRQCDTFVLLDCVQFEKNYFQNRNRIRTAWGSAWLTVPVFTKRRFGQTIREVSIRNEDVWRRKHRESLVQHYRAAPFFKEHFPALEALYDQCGNSLADFNIAVIAWLAGAFGLARRFVRASELAVAGRRSELLLGICEALGAREYLSGVSGKTYLDESLFVRAGIAVRYQDFRHPVYRQCYEPFLPMMTSVDLLFNAGPEALRVVRESNGHQGAQINR